MVTTIIGYCFMGGAALWAFLAWISTGMVEGTIPKDAWMDAIPHWLGAIIPLALGAALVWR